MNRKPIFDAARNEGADFNSLTNVQILDNALSLLGFPLVTDTMLTYTPSEKIAEAVKGFEGCKLTAYPDPGSGGEPWTIGVGATGPGIVKGTVWTQKQADDRLRADLGSFGKGVTTLLAGAPTTQNEFDAMVSLAFNIGLENFKKSTLLKLHKASNKAAAGNEFLKWDKASGHILPGLVKRRAAERRIYTGDA